jgi:hypothetical protein
MEATRTQIEDNIRRWRTSRAARLEQDRLAARMKEREEELKEWLIAAMRGQKYEGVVIDNRITGVNTKQYPEVVNRQEFCEHILETGALELLQFRVSTTAIKEHKEAGKMPPGIEYKDDYDLFDRKT